MQICTLGIIQCVSLYTRIIQPAIKAYPFTYTCSNVLTLHIQCTFTLHIVNPQFIYSGPTLHTVILLYIQLTLTLPIMGPTSNTALRVDPRIATCGQSLSNKSISVFFVRVSQEESISGLRRLLFYCLNAESLHRTVLL